MSVTDIDDVGKDCKLSCFQTSSKRPLKRKHSEIEEAETKTHKKSIFASIGEKLGFTRVCNQPPKSILSPNSSNRRRLSGEMNRSYLHDYHSFNVTNEVEPGHEIPKKRVKFDEENLIVSSITYQRQCDEAQFMMPKPILPDENQSIFSKFVNFTASLF